MIEFTFIAEDEQVKAIPKNVRLYEMELDITKRQIKIQ
jgi:hypothetical protein